MKSWSHHLHDGMLSMWHHIDEHLRSRHFWAGVGITLLLVGFVTLLIFAVKNAPIESGEFQTYGIPYSPY
jgi:hypothetical protein